MNCALETDDVHRRQCTLTVDGWCASCAYTGGSCNAIFEFNKFLVFELQLFQIRYTLMFDGLLAFRRDTATSELVAWRHLGRRRTDDPIGVLSEQTM